MYVATFLPLLLFVPGLIYAVLLKRAELVTFWNYVSVTVLVAMSLAMLCAALGMVHGVVTALRLMWKAHWQGFAVRFDARGVSVVGRGLIPWRDISGLDVVQSKESKQPFLQVRVPSHVPIRRHWLLGLVLPLKVHPWDEARAIHIPVGDLELEPHGLQEGLRPWQAWAERDDRG
ncbi:hypothetical protein [Inhella proteolytica]|uniref:Uncharacterized protein n=1 Tax=Inhella proteolytica TaxID=2795029 RepID=A0A931IZ57_9BURK|nr:hypothetical protein [Inhella proteolytica]MBH9576474.1 hypothetical protein [Inhella proteolytica]